MEKSPVIDNSIDKIDDFEDPLAVKVGLFIEADGLPAEGWPRTFKPEVKKTTSWLYARRVEA
jgi:hypothetical protein